MSLNQSIDKELCIGLASASCSSPPPPPPSLSLSLRRPFPQITNPPAQETILGKASSTAPYGYTRMLPGARPELHLFTPEELAIVQGTTTVADNTEQAAQEIDDPAADFLEPEWSPLLEPVPRESQVVG